MRRAVWAVWGDEAGKVGWDEMLCSGLGHFGGWRGGTGDAGERGDVNGLQV